MSGDRYAINATEIGDIYILHVIFFSNIIISRNNLMI